MKKKLLTIGLCALLLSGCTIFERNPQAPEFIARAAAKDISIVLLSQHPHWRPHFERASAQLLTISTSEKIDITLVHDILAQIPIKELQTTTSKIIVSDSVLIIKALGNPTLKEDQQERLQKLVAGLRAGVEDALAIMPPSNFPPLPPN